MNTKEHTRRRLRRPKFGPEHRSESRIKSWFAWKKGVLNLIHKLPPYKAAEVVRRVAEGSIDAGTINRRTYEEANAWATRLLAGLRPGANDD